MSDTTRIRRRFDRSPGLYTADNPFVTLGQQFLETSPGHLVPLFGPVTAQVINPLRKGEICYDEIHAGPPYREGGNFTKVTVELPEIQVQGGGTWKSTNDHTFYGIGTGKYHYHGGFAPTGIMNGWNIPAMVNGPTYIPSTSAWELLAYKKTKPRIQKASAFVFAAEFRDTPRMLKGTGRFFHDLWNLTGGPGNSKLMQPKRVADNFLNHQFGWVPFISDLRKFHTTFQNAAAIKSRLTSENGKWIRRKVPLSDTIETRILAGGNGMMVEPAGYYIGTLFAPGESPTWELRETVHSYISAVGSYTYYRPEFDGNLPDYNSAWNSVQRNLSIYGARLSPANVYRATPWTWLIDWVTDFGSVMDKLDDIGLDGIAARYLYVMNHTERTQTFIQTLPFREGPLQLSWSAHMDGKVRRQASTPYGFGLEWKLLSPRQLAILAALKITH